MTKELMTSILMTDRCSKAEAERFITDGVTICSADDLGFLEELNQAREDDEEPITIESIKAGKVEDFSFVEYDNKEYYIAYVV